MWSDFIKDTEGIAVVVLVMVQLGDPVIPVSARPLMVHELAIGLSRSNPPELSYYIFSRSFPITNIGEGGSPQWKRERYGQCW